MKYNSISVKTSNATEKLAALLYLEKIFGKPIQDGTFRGLLDGSEYMSYFPFARYNLYSEKIDLNDGSNKDNEKSSLFFEFSDLGKINKETLNNANKEAEDFKLGDKVYQFGDIEYTVIRSASLNFGLLSSEFTAQSWPIEHNLKDLTQALLKHGFTKTKKKD